MTRPRVYLSGPVSLGGTLPPAEVERNISRFRAARERLTAEGWEVLDPTDGVEPWRPWDDLMRRAIGMLVSADHVLMLPGWGASRGACIERQLAMDLGIEVDHRDGLYLTIETAAKGGGR